MLIFDLIIIDNSNLPEDSYNNYKRLTKSEFYLNINTVCISGISSFLILSYNIFYLGIVIDNKKES